MGSKSVGGASNVLGNINIDFAILPTRFGLALGSQQSTIHFIRVRTCPAIVIIGRTGSTTRDISFIYMKYINRELRTL